MTEAAKFALHIVRTLQAAGFEALWAGGCVRDQLLGRIPKDYDVATNATPDQVRDVFGRRRTLMIGAAFGVVAVLGPKRKSPSPADAADTATHEQVEVATFRREEGYSDGRHPDHVAFSTAEQDAQRRDFTINGLFFDPMQKTVIDYVGGQADLEAQRIRCIGIPAERFDEDKLRMLRAIRFSTSLGFEIDPETYAAIGQHADELQVVSAERIAAEMRKVLTLPRAASGLADLQNTGLIRVVLPEYAAPADATRLPHAINLLDQLGRDDQPESLPAANRFDFPLRLAATVWPLTCESSGNTIPGRKRIAAITARWKLTNRERDNASWLLKSVPAVLRASELDWPDLQPVLVDPRIGALLLLGRAISESESSRAAGLASIEHCQNKLSLPAAQLDPEPLVDGHDLIKAGVQAGRMLGTILTQVRRLQLLGKLKSQDDAIRWAKQQ